MDDVSAELFESPTVEVGGYQEWEKEIQEACQVIFGYALTPEDFVTLIAAPDGSALIVRAGQEEESLALRLSYKWFNATHEYLIYADGAKRVVDVESFFIKKEAPELLGTRLIARLIKSCREFGIDEIRLFAAGYPNEPGGHAGYYFWPRVGFVMYNLGSIGAQLVEAGLEYVDNTLDLFSQAGGAEWWYTNGREGMAYFYLYEGSPCLVAHQAYLEAKGVNVDDGSEEAGSASEVQGGPC